MIKARIGGLVWAAACYRLIKFIGIDGGDYE